MSNDVIASLSAQIDASTVKLRSEMDAAAKSARAAGREIKESMAEGRAGIKQIGEEIGINLNRHLISFMAKLPGVAPLMAAAFPVAAIAGIGLAFVESGKKAVEWMQKQGEMGKVLAEGFESINSASRLSNDELAVTNDKLQEQIDKLSGRHPNNLKLEIDELVVEADKLSESLKKSNEEVSKLLEKNQVSLFAQFMGVAGTEDITKTVTGHDKGVEDAQNAQVEHVRAVQAEIHKLGNSREDEKKKAELAHDAKIQWDIDEKAKVDALKAAVTDLTSKWNEYDALQPRAGRGNKYGQFGGPDQTNNMIIASGAANHYQTQLDRAGEDELNLGLVAHVKTLTQGREELEKYLAVFHRLEDESYKLEDEQKKLAEETAKIQLEILSEANEPNSEALRAQTELFQSRISAAKEIQQANRDAANAQAEWNIKIQESTGMMTRQQAAVERDRLAVQRLQEQLAKELMDQKFLEAHPDLWTAKANPQIYAAQAAKTQGQLGLAQGQLGFDQQQNTLSGSMNTMFAEWIQKSTDLRGEMSRMWDEAISGVNSVLAKLMTGEYKKGDWGKMAKGLAGSASKSALQSAEGFGMKALGLGGKLGSTPDNAMWVRMTEGGTYGLKGGLSSIFGSAKPNVVGPNGEMGGAMAAAAPVTKGLLGWLNDSNFFSGLAGGKLFGGGGIFSGGLAGGGDFSPGRYLVGEHGPEVAEFGTSGYMHNTDSLRQAVDGGGGRGGDTHYHIDARGTDPALTQANVMRGMQQTHKQSVKDAAHVVQERQMRRPNR